MDSVLKIQAQKMECSQDLHAHTMVFGEGLMVLGVYVTQDFSDPWMVAHALVRSCLLVYPSRSVYLFTTSSPLPSPKVVMLECTYL